MKKLNWYKDANRYIFDNFKYPELFISLIAATSPRKRLTNNAKIALHIYNDICKDSFDTTLQTYSILKTAHGNNIRRSVKGEKLSGNKVESFRQNLLLNENVVTVDMWVLSYFKFTKSLTNKQYKLIEKTCLQRAKKHKLTGFEYQEYIWIKERSKNGYKPIYLHTVLEGLQR